MQEKLDFMDAVCPDRVAAIRLYKSGKFDGPRLVHRAGTRSWYGKKYKEDVFKVNGIDFTLKEIERFENLLLSFDGENINVVPQVHMCFKDSFYGCNIKKIEFKTDEEAGKYFNRMYAKYNLDIIKKHV